MSENKGLSEKIAQAKSRLPLPQLMQQLGLGEHAKKRARCPFDEHEDRHASFSVFQGGDGFWHFKCFSRCGDGDEIIFLSKLRGLPLEKAISLYLKMAGFPATSPPESRECHAYPKSPAFHVHPVSKGQALEEQLKMRAKLNMCIERNTARTRRWQLVRDLKAVEKGIGCMLTTSDLMLVFDLWYEHSKPFLDPEKNHNDYLAAFLGEFGKVRVPTGEGETLRIARENVSKLWLDGLPTIPGYPDAPESWRKLLAMHREVSRLSANGIYFLSYRNVAETCGISHQLAHTTTAALVTLGAIKIVSKGKAGLNSRKAAEFNYLLPQTENNAEKDCEVEI